MAAEFEFLGLGISESIGFAIGHGISPTIRPLIQDLVNHTWDLHRVRPLDYETAAQLAAERRDMEEFARREGAQQGISEARMDELILATRTGPQIGLALEMWRRGIIDEADFDVAVEKMKLAERFREPIKALRHALLSPDDLAEMRQRGYIGRDEQHAEAAKFGLDAEQADLMFENSGLPPGFGEISQMLHRSIINEPQFIQAIREANTKVKYTDEMLALSHPILSPAEAVRLRLKGWISADEAAAIGALSGFDRDQMEKMFLAAGRPAAPGQMATAVARKIDGPDGRPMDKAQFVKGIRESDIRPDWADMLWGIRFAYPPLFQINRLVQSGAIDAATAVDWAEKDRYAPEVVSALREYWSQPTAATTSGYTDKAKTQLWTATHNSYIAFESNKTAAGSALARLGVPVAERANIFALWDAERELRRKQLTPAQVKKAYRKPVQNPLTGAPWTRDDALAALLERGYSTADANTFLDE